MFRICSPTSNARWNPDAVETGPGEEEASGKFGTHRIDPGPVMRPVLRERSWPPTHTNLVRCESRPEVLREIVKCAADEFVVVQMQHRCTIAAERRTKDLTA